MCNQPCVYYYSILQLPIGTRPPPSSLTDSNDTSSSSNASRMLAAPTIMAPLLLAHPSTTATATSISGVGGRLGNVMLQQQLLLHPGCYSSYEAASEVDAGEDGVFVMDDL